MLWKATLVAGLATSIVLMYLGANAQIEDAPMPPRAAYLMWSALAAFGITWIAVWLAAAVGDRPRDRAAIRTGAIVLTGALILYGVGLFAASLYTSGHPRSQASRLHAVELMLLAIVVVGLLGGLVDSALQRRDRRSVSA